MKKLICAITICSVLFASIITINAAETHTEWTSQDYDGSASAYACADSAAASATGEYDSGFVRAIIANSSGRKSDSDERPAGETASIGFSIYELPDSSSPLTTSFASAWIGDIEVVCSQYY